MAWKVVTRDVSRHTCRYEAYASIENLEGGVIKVI